MKPILLLATLVAATGCISSRTAPRDNARLTELYTQDQADRESDDEDHWRGVSRRDVERRADVRRILDAGDVRTAGDHFHAAMVFQHGEDSTDYRRAHELAGTAERMGDERARWLAVASLDRYLLSTGHPQRYATQFLETPTGLFLQRLDSTAVTDAERHRAGARTLAETRAYLALQNGTPTGSLEPPPERQEEHAETVDLIGGVEVLTRGIVYPSAARTARVEGRVRVEMTVLPDGTVSEPFVVEGLGYGLDEEALRVVRQARFVNHVGEPWPVRLVVPFTLP